MARRVDGFCSTKAQLIYPEALVYCDSSGPVEVWTLERPGEQSLGLGDSFKRAQHSLLAMLKASRAGQKNT